MNARLTAAAWWDAFDIAEEYDERASGLGDRFLDAVEALRVLLELFPRIFARVPRAPAGREVREARVKGFPYRAEYEVTPTEVIVLAVTHLHSTRRTWRRRLP